jgi:LPXTG-motif cell wall-anchored protein
MAIHPSFSRRRRARTVVGLMAIGLPLAGAAMPASSASAARPMLADITVEPYGKCNSAGVWVTNTSGSDIEVRLYLDGAPAFVDNPWLPVPDGEGRLVAGEAPAPGSTFELVQRGPADAEIPLGSAIYARPAYCDAFVVTFADECTNVTVTVASSSNTDAVFTIAQTEGPTYPIVELFAVPAGQTASVDVAITPEIDELGLFLDAESDYLAFYDPQGPESCGVPVTEPEPEPEPEAEPECTSTTVPDTTPPETTPPPTDPTPTTPTVPTPDPTTTTSIQSTTTTSTMPSPDPTTTTSIQSTTTTSTMPTPNPTTTTSTVVIVGIPVFIPIPTTTQPVPGFRGAAGASRGFGSAPAVAAVPCPDGRDTPGDDPGTPGDPGIPGGTLPATGAPTTTVAALAALLVLTGGTALTLTRRRRA